MPLTKTKLRGGATTTLRSLVHCCLLGLLGFPTLAHATPDEERAATVHTCTAGPVSVVARAERQQGDAGISAARVLPNPDLVLQHQQGLSGPEDRETIVGLSVPLGIGGRRALLKDAAVAWRDQASAAADATLFEAAIAFRQAYAQAELDSARVRVVSEQHADLEALSGVVQALARGGESAPYDLLRQQTQVRLHRQVLDTLRADAAASQKWLQAWTGEPIRVSGEASSLLGLAGGDRVAQTMKGRAITSAHPLERSLQATARASAMEAKAARRRGVPDPTVFAGYRATANDAGTGHGVSLGLTLPLTFFDHGQGDALKADARGQLASATLERVKSSHAAIVQRELARLRELEASIAVLDQTVIDTRLLRDKARLLYAGGEATIFELLDAYRTGEDAELARLDLVARIVETRLELMRAAGTQFDPGLDKACGGDRTGGAP